MRGKGIVQRIPRDDTNGVCEDEVTVTSGLHAQAESTKKTGDDHVASRRSL